MSLIEPLSPPVTPFNTDHASVVSGTHAKQTGFLVDHLSLISIIGPDAEGFLQNQLSNDIEKIEEFQVQLNAYCNPKGRVLALLHVMQRPDQGYWALVPRNLSDGLIKRLGIYVMRAKLTVQIDKQNAVLGMLGKKKQLKGLSVYDFDSHIRRSIAIGDPRQVNLLANRLDMLLDADYWRLSDILSGQPQIYTETSEQCIPQHINMDLISGISFSKGCYPGQEIIARLRYLGKSKYRLCTASVATDRQIMPGEPVFEKAQAERKSGLIIDAVKTSKDTSHVSVMLKISDGQHPKACLNSGDGPELSPNFLPYAVPAE